MKIVLAAGFIMMTFGTKVTSTQRDKPEWMDMKQLSVEMKAGRKPVIIDLYTTWCYWCKVMDKKTYANSKVADYINEHFYPVKLDAETKESVNWNEKDFNYNVGYKVNDFALFLTSGQLAFPSTVIIPDKLSQPVAIAGFLEPKEIEPILKYFGEGAYRAKSYEAYKLTFKSTW